ncbi:chemotaxis-specific protein-glutamate methyltransferase CheB [Gluconacetobacter entanii]|uniref:Protein-glutamate methylesterase/protein-glutamine glutaminase n=1 Tax=Gluconacetobacter entanii TaxID=108528 RepID=A0A318Q1Z4_9PROT|nr:chemotaxis-specific protein-glutamate methyltransferase CheB [Gluconacetobacter entanii]PYD64792.1 chemotaxis response regulator protein-glutamate methylesterase [Gluconacetobacter entanii]
MPAAAPRSVLVVEDSAVLRHLLSHSIRSDARLRLIDAVESAEEAIRLVPHLRPDVISMDVCLPGMDGLEATRRIMAQCPTPIVIVSDALDAQVSMNALRSGALAVIEKPRGLTSEAGRAAVSAITTQLYIMSQVPVIRRRLLDAGAHPPQAAPLVPWTVAPRILALAASTGGPRAFAQVLGALPADFPLPVVGVQHMGGPFMEGFAHWLDQQVPMPVALARHGEVLRRGHVYIAPGDRHLGVGTRGEAVLLDMPPVQGQRPSASVLFSSVARAYGRGALGVLMTGMGEDGAQGLGDMRRAGGYTMTEDRSTAVIHGMPGAAERAGATCISLPLPDIAPHIERLLSDSADPPEGVRPPGDRYHGT